MTDSPPSKPRKKRYAFRAGDDELALRTLLENGDIFAMRQRRRSAAWEVITDTLSRRGITANIHSLRCRLRRLILDFQNAVDDGKQPEADFTPLETLLEQYMEAEAQYEQKKAEEGASEDEEETNGDTEAENGAPKKPRRRRFNFEDWHDLMLLNAVLDDEGIVMGSGEWKHAWKDIEASVNSQGVSVKAHSIRGRIRLMLHAYRTDPSAQSLDPAEMSAKQKFLREYCKKLDDMKFAHEGNDDQSVEPTREEEERAESGEANAVGLNRPQASASSPGSGIRTASEQETVTSELQTTQRTPPPWTPRGATRAPLGLQTRNATATTSLEATRTSSPVRPARRPDSSQLVAASGQAPSKRPAVAATEVAEPAWKRQKLELETILQGFVSDQTERQREQREDERARFTAQQELQKQTIDLQKRALDIQEKAMNMQDRLMALMEKVMDKLN